MPASSAGGYLSIEAGDSVVKVCQISGKGKSGRLTKSFMFRTPVGTVSDGLISDPSLLADKLNEKLAENGMTGIKNVVFTLASSKVATREAVLPPVKESKIRPILDTNMTEYFPMDISKYQIDFGMVRQTDNGETKGTALTLMAAPLSMADSYVKFARAAGLIIEAIDYAGNSQFQLIKSLGNKKVSMYINVDCLYSFVSIVADGALIFQRMLPYGGNDYIEAYRSATEGNLDYVDALYSCCVAPEAMKASGVMTADTIEDSLSRVVSGIERSMDFFNTLRYKDPLEEVFLLGSCARLAGLREMIAETIQLGYVSYLEDSPLASSLGVGAATISAYVSAYGAVIAPVKLLPPSAEATKDADGKPIEKKEGSLLVGILGALVIALAGGVLVFFAWTENQDLKAEKARLETEIAASQFILPVEQSYLQYIQDAATYTQLELKIESEAMNEGLVRFFEELERKMPSDLSVLAAVCTNEGVSMSCQVLTLEQAAKVIVAFRSFESLDTVSISSVSEETDELGFTIYSFSIATQYYVEPEPEPEPEPAAPPPSDDEIIG